MHLRRGIAPVLYHIYHDDHEVGDVSRTAAATVVVSFHGFPASGVAVSAAWLAYSGRLAYEAQFAPLASDGPPRFPPSHQERAATAGAHELVAHPDGDAFRLLLDGDPIARLVPSTASAAGATWSVELGLGPADTPVVFALAAARRMWQAIRGAGLWRRMAPWSLTPDLLAEGAIDGEASLTR